MLSWFLMGDGTRESMFLCVSYELPFFLRGGICSGRAASLYYDLEVSNQTGHSNETHQYGRAGPPLFPVVPRFTNTMPTMASSIRFGNMYIASEPAGGVSSGCTRSVTHPLCRKFMMGSQFYETNVRTTICCEELAIG